MAEHHVEPHVAAWLKMVAPYAPGIAGAVLALAVDDKTPLTIRGRLIKLGGGLVCAAFVGPALAALADLFWPGVMPKAVSGAVVFGTGLFAMRVIPPLMAWAVKIAGDPMKLLKIQIGAGGVTQEPAATPAASQE